MAIDSTRNPAGGSTRAPDDSPFARFTLGMPPGMFVGFLAAALAIILIAVLSYQALQDQAANRGRTLQTLASVSAVEAMLSALKDAETGQRGFLLTGEEAYLAPFDAARSEIPSALAEIERLTRGTPEQSGRLDSLRRLTQEKLDELQQTIELRRSGNPEEALRIVRSDRGKASMDRIRQLVGDMGESERTLLAGRNASLQAAAARSFIVVLGGSALLLVLIITGGTLMGREVRTRATESWLRQGQAALSQTLQGEQRLDVLGDHVLRFMASRLDAQVGAFYVREPGGTNLKRVAGYALSEDSTPAAIALGQGLVGEAAREDRVLRVADVPESYLTVASGLGGARPRHLLLVPGFHNGRINSVMELAMFRSGRGTDVEFLDRARSTIAVAVNASIDRTRLEELLEETQRQSEELASQQEELRVANEELTEQSQALRQSQVRLEQQQVELEQTNSQLEEQARTLEDHADRLAQGQSALVEKAAELTRANEYKSEFLANMSHELRTPLNSSLILAKLLADNKHGNLNEEQIKFAQTIFSAGNDLLALINDILDLSKIEAGKMELHREHVSVARVVDSMEQAFGELARSKGLKFACRVEPGAQTHLTTDSQRLSQILRNLLSNALKFTAAGEVELTVSAASSATHGAMLQFAVRDTGIGIADDQQVAIFEAFRQADGSTHRKFGGTGLGLSISRDLARLLGGEVLLTSKIGVGSTFTLRLPLEAPASIEQSPPRASQAASLQPAPPRPAPPPAMPPAPSASPPAAARPADGPALRPVDDRERLSPEGRNLLIIEDDVSFANILRDLAREFGFDAILTHSAGEGLAAVRSYRVSAVLLDMNLPDRTGLTVLDELKRNPDTRHIPVHVVSVADYSQEALSRGAIGYALKPVDRQQLLDALQKLTSRLTQGLRRVLVVEDDSRQRDSIEKLLGADGVEITTAASAGDALAHLQRTTFDCMVLDVNLPDLSGYELLERMSDLDTVSYPPVIVYTGRSLSRDEEQRLRRFSRSIIIKDARSPERLLDEVTLFLHQVEATLPAERQRMLRAARDREAALDGKRILVVEDDVRNIFALTKVLEPRGAHIDIARNGREALEHMEKTRDTEHAPDLVLMDIMMPEMDGLTAMREIRRHQEWRRLPIIALTAKAMRDDQEKCLQAGASDYLAKPLDVERLLSLVRVWMPQ